MPTQSCPRSSSSLGRPPRQRASAPVTLPFQARLCPTSASLLFRLPPYHHFHSLAFSIIVFFFFLFFSRDQPHLPSSSATPFLSRPAAPIISSSATMSTITFSSFSFSSCPFFSSSPPSPPPPPPPPQHAPDAGGDPGAGYQRQ